MVTAAEILQVAHLLARQQPPPGPAQPQQQQPARDGEEEGGNDDDTEAAHRAEAEGAQQVTGKRKRKNSNKKGTKFRERRKQARLGLQRDTSGTEDQRTAAMEAPRDPDSDDAET